MCGDTLDLLFLGSKVLIVGSLKRSFLFKIFKYRAEVLFFWKFVNPKKYSLWQRRVLSYEKHFKVACVPLNVFTLHLYPSDLKRKNTALSFSGILSPFTSLQGNTSRLQCIPRTSTKPTSLQGPLITRTSIVPLSRKITVHLTTIGHCPGTNIGPQPLTISGRYPVFSTDLLAVTTFDL